MDSNLFDVPISFHVFNRPNATEKVFSEIRKIRPKQLFITADGPRDSRKDDLENCNKVRSIVKKIDWECELYTNFSDENKGSFRSTSEGISWVFEHVNRAIILEDDCVPGNIFFRYCRELLDYYEHDKRVGIISGNNFQNNINSTENSYYFSRYPHIWGWATWKRTWDQVDLSMRLWPEYDKINGLKGIFSHKKELYYWRKLYMDMYEKNRKSHWDFLLLLALAMNNSLTVLPKVNLVSNIGFGPDAANCKHESEFHNVQVGDFDFPLKHPKVMCRFIAADDYTELRMFSGTQKIWKEMLKFFLPEQVVNFLKKAMIVIRA
jgi:hypothetical protein